MFSIRTITLPHYRRSPEIWFSLVLVAAALLLYWPYLDHDFVFDDEPYITDNPFIKKHVSGEGMAWAFGGSAAMSWHPVTWVSLMVDHQLYGLAPFGYHITNLLIHILSSLLLFFVLRRMSGAFWPSALAAVLFAFHPINVESVIWASQRKNVLGALFWMLSMWAYTRYAERPDISKYFLICLFFALGLMSKLTVITFPMAMLLLDYWPLRRLRIGRNILPPPQDVGGIYLGLKGLGHLILEKVPFLTMSVGVTFPIIYFDPNRSISKVLWPLEHRVSNALVSYVKYLEKLIWPTDLAIWYPFPAEIPFWQPMGALLLLSGITVIFLWRAGTRPYLIIGWLWFLGVLFPGIGVVQSEVWPAMADRHVYIAAIGIFVMVSWGLWEVASIRGRGKWVFVGFSLAVVAVLAIATGKQLRYWHTPLDLWRHALETTKNNAVAHQNYGYTLLGREGRTNEAVEHLLEAIRIKPNSAEAHSNLGNIYIKLNEPERALSHLLKAVRIKPEFPEPHINLAVVFSHLGRQEESASQYQEALRLRPDYAEAHSGYGRLLLVMGRSHEALLHFQKALQLKPKYAKAHNGLGQALAESGQLQAGLRHFQEALRLDPDLAEAHYNLGTALARLGQWEEAALYLKKAIQNKPDMPQAHLNLAGALLNLNMLREATDHYREVIRLDPNNPHAKMMLEKLTTDSQ